MGRVRTKTVKKASRVLIEKYYPRLTLDFHTNKKITDQVALIRTKRLRNKIAGFTTHLMKRIQKGPVRGISFKLQEEERERRDNWVPDVSAVDVASIEVDNDTKAMLKSIDFGNMTNVHMPTAITGGPSSQGAFPKGGRRREGGERGGERRPRTEGGERRPRTEGGERRPRTEGGERRPRTDRGERGERSERPSAPKQ